MASAPSSISTPCIQVCFLDPVTEHCVGCGRTRGEIANWGRLSERERKAIMAGLAQRLASLGLNGDPV